MSVPVSSNTYRVMPDLFLTGRYPHRSAPVAHAWLAGRTCCQQMNIPRVPRPRPECICLMGAVALTKSLPGLRPTRPGLA